MGVVNDVDIITAYSSIPYSVISKDLTEYGKQDYFRELEYINGMYDIYENGIDFTTEGSNANYIPSDLRYKKASSILNKEARFMFANPPSFNINMDDVNDKDSSNTILQDFVNNVLESNNINDKILKACKDCFIGKRIAIVLNFNEETGITITFLKSTEFVFETVGNDINDLKKIVMFYNQVDTAHKKEQRWFKKVYSLENGYVYVEEKIYDGLGNELEEVIPKMQTLFTSIPAMVVINDGLTGEKRGKSELGYLSDYESYYSKLANADIDAERKGMNPIRYAIDASSNSTSDLSIAPGSFWDIQSDEDKATEKSAQLGVLETNMGYSSALKTTLDRIENSMYAEVDVPNINSEQLQGVITSGKTLKALYWGLKVRCDEKMLAWIPALSGIVHSIILGGILYPTIAKKYSVDTIPDIMYNVIIANNYPLPDDIAEEKNIDLAEIQSNTMSRKSYLKKWRNLSDEEADNEIAQIKAEIDLFDNASMMPETEGLDVGGEIPEDEMLEEEMLLEEDVEDTEIEDQLLELERMLE